ncbi:hypothetical protein SCHPADRAFT_1002381 [Schizopora paradoxa]|uniref:F-box domain-containing protein n=1 Tax=Schizopora paradoxa TaxID=27342 RepID=A0A0H2R3G2_9AGAM|nr:hypothetical protein SCHPADRAFT_1002381 [Schizopora paradoxa]
MITSSTTNRKRTVRARTTVPPMASDLEIRRDVMARIDKSCFDILIKEFSLLSDSKNSGRVFEIFRYTNSLLSRAPDRTTSKTRRRNVISMQMHNAYQLSKILEILEIFTKEATKLYDETMAHVGPVGTSIGEILNGMPEELLSLTIDMACDNMRDLVRLSHVNRRFRAAAEGVTHLCSHIDPSLTLGKLDAYLSWTKNSNLHIEISQYQGVGAKENEVPMQFYLDRIIPTSHRWQSLQLLCGNEDISQDSPEYTQIKTRMAGIDLSKLRRLEYTYKHGSSPEGSVHTGVSPSGHIYSTWSFPNLRNASFKKLIPHPFPHHITSLTLDLPDRERKDEELANHLWGVQTFLKESPSIVVLRIRTAFKIDVGFDVSYPKLTMPNVQELSLGCKFDAVQAPERHPLSSFVQSLSLPRVSGLSIQFEVYDKAGFGLYNVNTFRRSVDIAHMILPLIPPDSSRIQTLGFAIMSNSHNVIASFYVPIQNFPSVQDLSLDCSGYANDILLATNPSKHSYDFPPINRLSISGCTKGGALFLEQVLQLLAKSDGKPLVNIKNCSSISRAQALDLVGAENLTYSPREGELAIPSLPRFQS